MNPTSSTTGAARPRADKVMSLAHAVENFVRPGDTIHAAYSDARPNAALMQLLRHFAGTSPRLRLVTAGLVSTQHALVEFGIVDHVSASFVGENCPVAKPNPVFQRAYAEGRVQLANWSMWSLVARLMAGALGVPHFPVRSLVGSSIAEEHAGVDFAEVPDPFGGAATGVVSALNPDVVLLHAVAADRHGNVILSAPYGEAQWGALAARRGVIVTVERIVDTDTIRRHNALVRIPAHVVLSVSEVPYGSHPYGIFNPGVPGISDYVEDFDYLEQVFAASASSEDFRQLIEDWILGTETHEDYLARLGSARLAGLTGAAAPEHWRRDVGSGGPDTPATPGETQVVAASRRIIERVEKAGLQTILAGVGLANLASWSAVEHLHGLGNEVALMSEIGMYGYTPRPGEPFIFAHRNLPTCTMLTDVAGVLATMVGGPATTCLGVLGAGEVDQCGNTNSTFGSGGEYLVGSGGANDIASGADEVLLTIAHRRLVEKVSYVTCPGHNVTSIVTSSGVFERDGDGFVLLRYLPNNGSDLRAAVEAMRAESPWSFRVAREATAEKPPTRSELDRLRAYDPKGVFLRPQRSRTSR